MAASKKVTGSSEKKSSYKPAARLTAEEAMTIAKAELPVLRTAAESLTNLNTLLTRSTDFTFPMLEESERALEIATTIKKSIETIRNSMIIRGRSKLSETKLKPVMSPKD